MPNTLDRSDMNELLGIMARLRDPKGGCPWDLDQDFASISPHTIEEAYEVDEAIASGDLEALRDELGDLLFQVVFQARLAEEEGAFDFGGVVAAIVDKLIRRHPHIFAGSAVPTTVEGQRLNWEEIKAAERAAAGAETDGAQDPFIGIPRSLPALARSAKLAGRIERLQPAESDAQGTRNATALSSLDSASDAIRDVLDGLTDSGRNPPDDDERALLVGRGLRAWVALSRSLGVDAEQALRRVDDEAIASIRANHGQARPPQVR